MHRASVCPPVRTWEEPLNEGEVRSKLADRLVEKFRVLLRGEWWYNGKWEGEGMSV